MSNNEEGFEGCEKRLKIDFQDVSDLRCISRDALDDLLKIAECTIIGTDKSINIDAYVLSESSLFIFAHTVIIKTCGTTRLLKCLYQLLDVARSIGAQPIFVQFSRSDFMFPQKQPFPHQNFNTEIDYLNKFFCGTDYILGPVNGPQWHVYTAHVQDGFTTPNITLEILMWDLDENKMKMFYRRPDPEWTAKAVTAKSGIKMIIPGSSIDEHLFDPCGYSCNGLLNKTYFTIHVTPEPHCSFVSFETNINSENYNDLINQIVHIFQPQRWSISLVAQGYQHFFDVRSLLDWHFQGFKNEGITYHKFDDQDSQDNAIVGRFKKVQMTNIERKQFPQTYPREIKVDRRLELDLSFTCTQSNAIHFIDKGCTYPSHRMSTFIKPYSNN